MTELLDLSSVGEITARYLADERPPRSDRPWITLGMIASLDGSATVAGGSTGLGGPADLAVLRALRAVADVIVVGATTVNTEGYGSVELAADLRGWREERGMAPLPRLAIVSNSLNLALADRLLESRPLLITSGAAPAGRLAELAPVTEVMVAGEETVDLPLAMLELAARGVRRVTLEGGPTLNGQMTALIDEVSMTVAPLLVGGLGSRIVVGRERVRPGVLARVIHSDGHLLLRYLLQ